MTKTHAPPVGKHTPEPDSTDDHQLGLADMPPTAAVARRTDPATSHEAAKHVSLLDLRASQLEVMQLYRRFGPMDYRTLSKMARQAGSKLSDSRLRSAVAELRSTFRTGDGLPYMRAASTAGGVARVATYEGRTTKEGAKIVTHGAVWELTPEGAAGDA